MSTTITGARGTARPVGHAPQAGQRKVRKRELDRIHQQRKRQKERERVRDLELKLESLHQRADDKLVYDMTVKHENIKARISRHLLRVEQIQALLKADVEDLREEASRVYYSPGIQVPSSTSNRQHHPPEQSRVSTNLQPDS